MRSNASGPLVANFFWLPVACWRTCNRSFHDWNFLPLWWLRMVRFSMIRPAGVNKGTGLAAALRELKLSTRNVVGIGDAENDVSFLSLCGFSVAVANALPALKEQADYTTRADHGDGVIELIEQLLADDLKALEQRIGRHALDSPLGP